MKKVVAVILLVAAIGGGIYYYIHTKKSKDVDPAPVPAPDPVVEEKEAVKEESLEDSTFNQMSNVLEGDPVWNNAVFPADFYPAVLADFENIKAGNPRAPNYNYGKVGAFMSVVDAWKDAMHISQNTHQQLWTLYSAYISEYTKSKL